MMQLVLLDDASCIIQQFTIEPGLTLVGRVLEPEDDHERNEDRQAQFGPHHSISLPSIHISADHLLLHLQPTSLTCLDLGSRNGTYILTTQDTNLLNAQAEYQISTTDATCCTFLRLGATDIAICGPDAPLLQDAASTSPMMEAAALAPHPPLQDLPPEHLEALKSLLEAAGGGSGDMQDAHELIGRLPSLQEWAPDEDVMQRLPSLQEWVRVNSMSGSGRNREREEGSSGGSGALRDRAPSLRDLEALASVFGVVFGGGKATAERTADGRQTNGGGGGGNGGGNGGGLALDSTRTSSLTFQRLPSIQQRTASPPRVLPRPLSSGGGNDAGGRCAPSQHHTGEVASPNNKHDQGLPIGQSLSQSLIVESGSGGLPPGLPRSPPRAGGVPTNPTGPPMHAARPTVTTGTSGTWVGGPTAAAVGGGISAGGVGGGGGYVSITTTSTTTTRKRMATPEMVAAAEALLMRHVHRPRVQ